MIGWGPGQVPLNAARRRSPHGGGGHSLYVHDMEGAGTPPTWRGRALSPHGGGGHSVHIEDWSNSISDPVSDLKLAEMYLKLPEIRVCPPERVMPKTCK